MVEPSFTTKKSRETDTNGYFWADALIVCLCRSFSLGVLDDPLLGNVRNHRNYMAQHFSAFCWLSSRWPVTYGFTSEKQLDIYRFWRRQFFLKSRKTSIKEDLWRKYFYGENSFLLIWIILSVIPLFALLFFHIFFKILELVDFPVMFWNSLTMTVLIN